MSRLNAVVLELWENSCYKLLYCAPERFDANKIINPAEIDRLARVKPNFLVVDEAHCIDRWGWDFRPAYGQIGKIRERIGSPPVLAFTATASPLTQNNILKSLGVPDAKRLLSDIDRPNIALIRLRGVPDDMMERAKIVDALLKTGQNGHSLIFVPTINIGKKLEKTFTDLGRNIPFYHAKLAKHGETGRDALFGGFTGLHEPKLETLICTNAFGMGLDVPDVRVVVHRQHPASVADYLQELGRAGRDGKQSIALLFTNEKKEQGLLMYMATKTIKGAELLPEDAERILKRRGDEIAKMGDLAQETACFRQAILRYMDVETRRRRRSISRWLLDLILVGKEQAGRSGVCCDYCDPDLTDSIRTSSPLEIAAITKRTKQRRKPRTP